MKELLKALHDGDIIMVPSVFYAQGFVLHEDGDESSIKTYPDMEDLDCLGACILLEKDVSWTKTTKENFAKDTVFAFSEFFSDDGEVYIGPARIKKAHRGCSMLVTSYKDDTTGKDVMYCPTCDKYVEDEDVASIDDFNFVYSQYQSSADNAEFSYYGPGFITDNGMQRSYVSITVELLTGFNEKAHLNVSIYRDSGEIGESLVAEKAFELDDMWDDRMQLEYSIDDEYLNVWVMFSEKKSGVQIKAEEEGMVIDFVETVDGQEEVVDECGWVNHYDIGWDFE
jgi:hypothetical protein